MKKIARYSVMTEKDGEVDHLLEKQEDFKSLESGEYLVYGHEAYIRLADGKVAILPTVFDVESETPLIIIKEEPLYRGGTKPGTMAKFYFSVDALLKSKEFLAWRNSERAWVDKEIDKKIAEATAHRA